MKHNFKDIRTNWFHVETNNNEGEEQPIMTKKQGDQSKKAWISYVQDHLYQTRGISNMAWYLIILASIWSKESRIIQNCHNLKTKSFPNQEDFFLYIDVQKGSYSLEPQRLRFKQNWWHSLNEFNWIYVDQLAPYQELFGTSWCLMLPRSGATYLQIIEWAWASK